MDNQIKELIAVGASIGAHCQPCLEYHVSKARELGITDCEISEAIAVGHMVEKGAMAAMKQFSAGILDAELKPSAGSCCEAQFSGKKCC